MSATTLKSPAHGAFGLSNQATSTHDLAGYLFAALAPLHELEERDAALLGRAASGYRFIRAMQPFGDNEHSLMRIALADLPTTEAFVVEASASYVADLAFEAERGAWSQLRYADKRRVMWFAAILRLAEGIDATFSTHLGAIHVAWTAEILHLEVDGVVLTEHAIDRVLRRTAALEATTGRRVLFTSSACRRGAAQ